MDVEVVGQAGERRLLAYDSYWKNHGISEELYIKGHDVIE